MKIELARALIKVALVAGVGIGLGLGITIESALGHLERLAELEARACSTD